MDSGYTDSGLADSGYTDSGSRGAAKGNAAYRNAAKRNGSHVGKDPKEQERAVCMHTLMISIVYDTFCRGTDYYESDVKQPWATRKGTKRDN